jgi:thiamine biosynthesis lipoprotein
MGTDAGILVAAPNRGEARRMVAAALERIRAVESRMSTYRPDSEISRLNARAARQPVELSPITIQVLREAKRFTRLTDGAFDATYAPLRTLWRRAQDQRELPSEAALQKALSRVDSSGLVLEGNTARFAREGMEVDLGGIAKGFAIDLAIEALAREGATSALVDVGGDIRVLGRRRDGEKWKIQMRDPRPEKHASIVLRLEDAAVATSGDYARFLRIGDRRYSHIIDPRSGHPVENVPSVTVIAPDALTADALATSANVMGTRRDLKLIDSLDGVECMIMQRTKNGRDQDATQIHFSQNFQSLVDKTTPGNE